MSVAAEGLTNGECCTAELRIVRQEFVEVWSVSKRGAFGSVGFPSVSQFLIILVCHHIIDALIALHQSTS